MIHKQNNERSHMVQLYGNRIYKAGHDAIFHSVCHPVYYKATVAVTGFVGLVIECIKGLKMSYSLYL